MLFFMSAGCSAQPAIEEDSRQQREIVRVSVPTTDEASPEAAGNGLMQVSGVLDQRSDCTMLVPNGDVFSQPVAQSAWLDFEKKNFEAAAKGFEHALEAEPPLDEAEKQRAYFLAAQALYKTGEAENKNRAVDFMKFAFISQESLSRIAAVYGTQMSFEAERWADTLQFADALLSEEDYRTYRAIALTNLGRYDAAAAEFERIDKYPKNIRLTALEARARTQDETAQHRSALETYRRIYEIDPKSDQGQLAYEAIMAQKETWPKGFEFPRNTAAPDKSQSAREQASAHFNAHRSEQAIAAYTKLLKDDKKRHATKDVCDDLYAIARSHVKLRAHTRAIPFFTEALETCQKTDLHIKILYTGAKAAWNAGQNALALQWYQQIVDGYADHSYADDAYHYQSLILQGMGRDEDARQKLQDQIRAYPDGDMAKDAYWALLQDLYERGLYRDAVKFVDDHLAHAGEDDLYSQGRLRYFQARAYEKLNEKDNALGNYLKILSEYPLSYYAMLALGRIEASDRQQARTWIEAHRGRVYTPESAQSYCFTAFGQHKTFEAVRQLVRMHFYQDALEVLAPLVDSAEPRQAFEAKLARSLILQKLQRHSESARLAASLLVPQQDLVYQAYAAWIMAYPMPWRDLVTKAADPGSDLFYTTYAIMREESYYNPKAESWANARGLMQVMLPTAQSTAAEIGMKKPTAGDLFEPQTAIPIGSAYIRKLMKILVPHPMFVLPGYNAGQGNVGKWMAKYANTEVDLFVEKIPFKEARHYAKRVGTTLWRYRWLYDDKMPELFDPAKTVRSLP